MLRTLIAAALLLATASGLHAQTPTGSITGRVIDASNLSAPGVTVTIASPNLQGIRTTVTSAGRLHLPAPAARPIHGHVELRGFANDESTRQVGAGEPVDVNATLHPAAVSGVGRPRARQRVHEHLQAPPNQQELL